MKNRAGTQVLFRGATRFVLVLLLLAGFAGASFAEERMPLQQKALQIAAVVADPNNYISISGDLTTISKEALVQTLVGDGITVSNVKATNCHPTAAGLFSITGDVGIGLKSGIVLGSGAVANVVGPNTGGGTSSSLGLPGDPDLNAILATGTGDKTSYDACVVEFDFFPQASVVSFNYVFGSEEYNEYVNSQFNDVFGFFVNGQNCATINEDPVSINTINNGNPPLKPGASNADFYINNATGDYNTELDGFTTVLTCSAKVNPGVSNHIKLAIADAGDSILDSDVFIGGGSFVSAEYAVALSPSVQNASGNNTTTHTYVFEVKNMGGTNDYFDLTLSDGVWPTFFTGTASKSMTIGPLAFLQTGWAYVDVTIPQTATVDQIDTVTLTATSVGAGAAIPVSSSATATTTALGLNPCRFIRDLPSYYIPGIPMPVSIQAEPTCIKEGDLSWALEDIVPPGWLVTNISDGGGFSGGKVSFGSLPAGEKTLTYTVKPGLADTGDATFSGTGSVSGVDTAITGNSVSAHNAGDHPADTNHNQAISISEYNGYWSYWKSGKTWPSGWNPVKPSFVTKAGQIWATYTGYHFVAGTCPACWVVNPAGIASAEAANLAASAGPLTRTTPPIYKKGVAMDVSLLVTPPAGKKVYLVEERTPAGWVVSNIGNSGNFDAINKVIKWGPFKYQSSMPSRTLTYTVMPPDDASGEKTFMGLASFDGVDVLVNTIVPDILIHNVKFVSGDNGSITGETDQKIVDGFSSTAVTAVPDTNYAFINWTGTGGFVTTVDNPLILANVIKDQTVTANFALKATLTTKPLVKPLNFKGDRGKLSFTADTATLIQIRDAISADSFISVDMNSLKFEKGKGSLSYIVAANLTTDTLDGYIRIGTAQFNVKQAPTPCEILSVTVNQETLPNVGGNLAMMVDVYPYTCKWKITSAKVSPCANDVDPAVCLQRMFSDPGNLPEIGEIITGDKIFTAIIAPSEFTRTLSGKIEISPPSAGKSSKTFKVKQYK